MIFRYVVFELCPARPLQAVGIPGEDTQRGWGPGVSLHISGTQKKALSGGCVVEQVLGVGGCVSGGGGAVSRPLYISTPFARVASFPLPRPFGDFPP